MKQWIKNFAVAFVFVVTPLAVMFGMSYLESKEPKDVTVFASLQEFEYDELKEYADIIALVEINDELSKENSILVYDERYQAPVLAGFYSKRAARVLKYYKNNLNLGSDITIIEPVCISPNNEYIHIDDYEAMSKSDIYVVFLSTDNRSGQLSVISANNGRIPVADLDEYPDKELIDSAIVDLNLYEVINEISTR